MTIQEAKAVVELVAAGCLTVLCVVMTAFVLRIIYVAWTAK